MDVYKKKILRTSDLNILRTANGEIIRVLDTTALTYEGIEKIIKYPKVKPCYRLYVLFPDETIDYEIPSEDIILNTGSYNENYQQGQRRSLNISLVNIDGKYTPNINALWVDTMFRFDVGLQFYNAIFWMQKGIYIMSNPSTTYNGSDKQVTLQLSDKFARLTGKTGTFETTYELPVDSNIINSLGDLLTLNTGAGYSLDLNPIMYDEKFKASTTPYTLTKDVGSAVGDMTLDLATILSAECFYNVNGNLCLIDINETATDIIKPTIWHYKEGDYEFRDRNISHNFDDYINEVHVIGDNINGAIYTAVAQNNNPVSPISLLSSRKRVLVITDTNINTDTKAQDRANKELRDRNFASATISMKVPFNPLLLVNNIIEVDDEFFGWKNQKLIIKSISYNIGSANEMNLSCVNYNDLPFTL